MQYKNVRQEILFRIGTYRYLIDEIYCEGDENTWEKLVNWRTQAMQTPDLGDAELECLIAYEYKVWKRIVKSFGWTEYELMVEA